MRKSRLVFSVTGISLLAICSVLIQAHDAMAGLSAKEGDDKYLYIKATKSSSDKGVGVFYCVGEDCDATNGWYLGTPYEKTDTSVTWRLDPCHIAPKLWRFCAKTTHSDNSTTNEYAEYKVDKTPISVSISDVNFYDNVYGSGTFDISGDATFQMCPIIPNSGNNNGYIAYYTKNIGADDSKYWGRGGSSYGFQETVTWHWPTDTSSNKPKHPQFNGGLVLKAVACSPNQQCISDVKEFPCLKDADKDDRPDGGKCGCGVASITGIKPRQSPVTEGTKIDAETEYPVGASVKWSIVPDPEGKVHASITEEGPTATISGVSGSGDLTIKVSTTETCSEEFTIKIGCEACEGGNGEQCKGEAGSASEVGL